MNDGSTARHTIPFNRPYTAPGTLAAIEAAMAAGQTAGSGPFGARCEQWLEEKLGVRRALLTPSGSAALELAAMLLDLDPGDEVIMPSFTFPTTASAFIRAGATPVFVDIGGDSLNIDPEQAEAAITPRTRAITLVHYGGNACDIGAFSALAGTHGLALVEDAAHSVLARHEGRWLGSIGAVSALSFHETKNLGCGEGGALLINEERLVERAEILREKGTDRARFHRGEVDRYIWLDVGSSYVLSDINAAILWSQIEIADWITSRRLEIWHEYHRAFAECEAAGRVRRPTIGSENRHNAHLYYLLARDIADRDLIIERLGACGVHAVFHYVPLHSSPAGQRYGRARGPMIHTDDVSARLFRLPLWAGMSDPDVARVIEAVHASLR